MSSVTRDALLNKIWALEERTKKLENLMVLMCEGFERQWTSDEKEIVRQYGKPSKEKSVSN